MLNKSYAEKAPIAPRGDILRLIAADQKQLVAAGYIFSSTTYFGGLSDLATNRIVLPADYPAISRTLHAALRLDPYNMDGYYFAQAILVWEAGQVKVANALLEYGMQYRTWDFHLPLFAGFNYSYFLKEYDKAAILYQRTAELSGSHLYANLAGRYFHETGQTDHAIAFLSAMEKGAQHEFIKRSLQTRLDALKNIKIIEIARNEFMEHYGRLPRSVDELVEAEYLKNTPADPYGGNFYLEKDGQVRTTSKFTFGIAGKERR